MAVLLGGVVVLWGLARIALVVVTRKRGSLERKRFVGGAFLGAFWVLLGMLVLLAGVGASKAQLVPVAMGMCLCVVAANALLWPKAWARLGDAASWRGGRDRSAP
jgi:hypothetical protein